MKVQMQSTKKCSYNCTICIEWVHSTQPQLRTSKVQYSRLYTSLERLIELWPGGLSSIKSVLDFCTSLEYCTFLRSYNWPVYYYYPCQKATKWGAVMLRSPILKSNGSTQVMWIVITMRIVHENTPFIKSNWKGWL